MIFEGDIKMTVKNLYPSFQNPYLIRPTRPIPKEMAVVGSGTIGPDIAYGFRTAFPRNETVPCGCG